LHLGDVDTIGATIERKKQPFYSPEARTYVTSFPAAHAGEYPSELRPILSEGLIVLSQRCTHLGCRTPFCKTSQYFECPCHGALFDGVGEVRGGPAPRGLDAMYAVVDGGQLIVDTTRIVSGRPIGTNTIRQDPSGPSCISG
jgi:cytochrome b6-f complex iron-sulfur subunit